jgi:hypothetical protein
MSQEADKTGKELELWVADAYRQMGARKVEHDVRLAGNQIDVYVEMETSDRGLHSIAVEAKDWTSKVGVDIVNGFALRVGLLRNKGLIDEGVLVSASGFSKEARDAAATHGIRLLEPADLYAKASGSVPPVALPLPPFPIGGKQTATLALWRVFVASPSDVLPEREQIREVVEELNEGEAYLRGVRIELLDWREKVTPLMGRPQQVVLDQCKLEETDLLVMILWHRFGTPPGGTNLQTGRPFLSGTEEEFSIAYNLWKESGRPQISVYHCTRKIDPKRASGEQLARVQAFLDDFRSTGPHPGIVQEYEEVDEFRRRIRRDLVKLLYTFRG